ncbi:nitroreductase family deazaflavin-dependent oxidoreductase [Desulfobacterota bacterium AH_259_B03_O07]|nr:nitroreductase family deazaflavin-dependent oxidoreductase [Desulfobacterota bacterium AH_259_B03_O07]
MSGTVDQDSLWVRFLTWFGSSRTGAWTIITLGTKLDRWLIRATNGKYNATLAWPCLLLTTKGAKTGRARTVSLVYYQDGEDIIFIASKGGNLHHPAWYLNLKANPEVDVFLDGKSATYTAHEASGDERKRLWAKAVELYKGYETYKDRAGEREIPVVILKPS